MSKHQSNILVARCGDDGYSIPGHALFIGWNAIIEKEKASIRFEPGGGFGASLEFVLSETRSAWEHRLKLAPTLGIEKVLLVDHLGCGAFEATYGPMSVEEEEAKHLETIAVAKKMVLQAGLEFTAYLQNGRDFRQV